MGRLGFLMRLAGVSIDLFRKRDQASSSSFASIFWLFLGPLFMMLTLIIAYPIALSPYLPLIALIGWTLSWRYQFNGLSLALICFVLYFALHYFFGARDVFLWQVGFGCSLILGLTISFLSMEEWKSDYIKEKQKKKKAIHALELCLHDAEDKSEAKRKGFENEINTLKKKLSSSREEVQVLLNLVDASQIESDKVYKQNETLSRDCIDLERELESLKIEQKKAEEKLGFFQSKEQEMSKVASERLKALNALRTDLYQSNLLIEDYQKRIEKARTYFKIARKNEKTTSKEGLDNARLETLEKDKRAIKKIYDQTFKDYQKLKKACDQISFKVQKVSDQTLSIEAENLSCALKEKRKKLDQVKAKLVDIEREIFILKKSLREKQSF